MFCKKCGAICDGKDYCPICEKEKPKGIGFFKFLLGLSLFCIIVSVCIVLSLVSSEASTYSVLYVLVAGIILSLALYAVGLIGESILLIEFNTRNLHRIALNAEQQKEEPNQNKQTGELR